MEVAAISGHKSLSMLKRYTHLKATKLVKKLEGHRHKGKQVVVDHLIPYPAVIEPQGDFIQVRLLDFADVAGRGQCKASAMRFAQDALLRKIVTMIRGSEVIPPPDQYLETIAECRIVMVSPLGDGDV